MMENAFRKPVFHVGGTVPPKLLVDRTKELLECKATLLERRGNVLLVGKRRIGKTSLVNKLRSEIETQQKILCVGIDLVSYDQDPGGFLQDVLLLICYEIGERVFHKTTSELLISLGQKPGMFKGNFKRFHRIYELVRARSSSQRRGENAKIGVEWIARATVGETREKQITVGPLLPFEFIQLTQELTEICRKAHYESVIIFADEANRLATQTSKDILRSYFDVFSSRQIQFVFVADPAVIEYQPIQDIFDRTVELGPFDGVEDIHELLNRYYRALGPDYPIPFATEAVRKIWDLSKGHPYLVQLLCNTSVDVAHAARRYDVTAVDVVQAWVEELQKTPRLIDLWE